MPLIPSYHAMLSTPHRAKNVKQAVSFFGFTAFANRDSNLPVIGIAETFNLPIRFSFLFEAENLSKISWNFETEGNQKFNLLVFLLTNIKFVFGCSCLIASYLSFPYIPTSLLPNMLRDIASWTGPHLFPFVYSIHFDLSVSTSTS